MLSAVSNSVEVDELYKNRGRRIHSDMYPGDSLTVAASFSAVDSRYIYCSCTFRYYLCMVGLSSLRLGQLSGLVMDASNKLDHEP